MIQVGINENAILQKAAFNDKGTLMLTWRSLEEGDGSSNPFDKMNSASVEEEGSGTNLRLFGFKLPNIPGKDLSDTEKSELISGDITKLKNILTQILEQFLVHDQITWDVFKATGMTKENYFQRLLDEDVLKKIYQNMGDQFIAMVTPFLDKNDYAVRLKLRRQSADKHFATIPDRYIKDNPFIELMSVPKANSRVKFTKWELDNGLDSGAPVSRNAADAVDALPEESNVNAFGNRS